MREQVGWGFRGRGSAGLGCRGGGASLGDQGRGGAGRGLTRRGRARAGAQGKGCCRMGDQVRGGARTGHQGPGPCQGGVLRGRGGVGWGLREEGRGKSRPWGKGRCGGGQAKVQAPVPPTTPHGHFFGASAAPVWMLSLSHPGSDCPQLLSTRHSGGREWATHYALVTYLPLKSREPLSISISVIP